MHGSGWQVSIQPCYEILVVLPDYGVHAGWNPGEDIAAHLALRWEHPALPGMHTKPAPARPGGFGKTGQRGKKPGQQ